MAFRILVLCVDDDENGGRGRDLGGLGTDNLAERLNCHFLRKFNVRKDCLLGSLVRKSVQRDGVEFFRVCHINFPTTGSAGI